VRPDSHEAVCRLLHIETDDPQTSLADTITIGFIENALLFLEEDSAFTPGEIAQAILSLFELEFEPAELRQVLRLTVRNQPHRVRQTGKRDARFGLTAERRRTLEASVDAVADSEGRVFAAWEQQLRDSYPELTEDELRALVEDQRAFNEQMLLRYGARCQAMLSGDLGSRGEPAAVGATTDIPTSLPEREEPLATLRREALVAFWRDADGERLAYLSRLLDNACIIHTAHLDPASSALVREVFRGTVFYLDTNVLYRLLNLQGPRPFFQMRTVLDILGQIGAKPRVSELTLRELHTSLRVNADRVRQYPIASRALAQLGAEATSEQDFVSLYYADYARTGVGVDDFAAKVRNVGPILESLGVELEQDAHEDLLHSAEMDDERASVHLAAEGQLLHEHIVTHDAFHRLLILKMRSGTPSFARAEGWFLTCDGKMGRYDRIARRRSYAEVPFCMYPDQCMQMTRWALPRTDDYDRAFVQLVCSPYVTAITDLPSEASHLICARIDAYMSERQISERTATQLAVLTLVDKRLAASFRWPVRATEDEQIREIDEAIGRSLEGLDRKARQAQKAKELAEQAALRLRGQTAIKHAQLAQVSGERDRARDGEERAGRERDRERTARAAAEERAAAEQAARVQAEGARSVAEAGARTARLRERCLVCLLSWVLLVAGYLWLPWVHWPAVARPLYLALAGPLAALSLALPLGWTRGSKFALALCTVASLALAVLDHYG